MKSLKRFFLVIGVLSILLLAVKADIYADSVITDQTASHLITKEEKLLKDSLNNSDTTNEKKRLSIIRKSTFEEYVSKRLPFITDVDLKQFGYDLFYRPPSTFAPVTNIPISPDYIVGPGDEIRITIWGRVEGQWSVVISRDGTIVLPKIGVIGVAGLTFKELKDLLYKEFSRYYKGFEINVSLGVLKSIRVYVVGNAKHPGAYTISSLSTLINALFEAGGPSKTGTMRDIQVKRSGKTVIHFDMYDFLLKGDKTKDIRLMPEDVIFIPPVGPLVALAGMVKNPAIYELKSETTLAELINMAGGLNDIAFEGRVSFGRITKNRHYITEDYALNEALNFKVKGGDIIVIYPITDEVRKVRIAGAVNKPGEYGYREGMTIKELISMAGGLKYYAYSEEAELTRVYPSSKGPITKKIKINLKKALDGDPVSNIKLEQDDYIFIRAVPEWDLYKTVTISGEVKFPGIYTIKKGEKLSDLIERAGGFTKRAYLKGAVFTRNRVRKLQQMQIDEMIDRLERELFSTGTAQIATASSPDEAKMMQMELQQKKQFIQRLRNIKAKGRITIRLAPPDQLKGTPYDIELEDGDSIYVPTDPGTVQVIGSVYNQAAFVYQPEKNYKYYIGLAGGYTKNADIDNVYILKADGSAVRLNSKQKGLVWNKDRFRWEFGGAELKVESGDTIVVPEKLERIAWMRNVKDITQILYQIAVTAGVLIAAF